MKLFPRLLLLCLMAVTSAPPEVQAATNAVDCACVQGLPSLIVSNCPALVPDLCALSTNCFSTNVVIGSPGYCFQSMPPGTQAYPGTNTIFYYVTDAQSNTTVCSINFVVVQPPNPTLSLVGTSNKTVECGTGWDFNPPNIVSTCCDPGMALTVLYTQTNGTCPLYVTRAWKVTNICGLTATATQMVTVVDAQAPASFCGGMNLVPNSSFETNNGCPNFLSQVSLAPPWFSPTIATPDYLSSCATLSAIAVPTNAFGVQAAYNGQAYCAAILYNQIGTLPTNSYREYIETPLLAPLVTGQLYQVSFRVSLAETSHWAIANIGAHLSSGPVVDWSGQGVLTVTPQIQNPTNNPLTSTTSWMQIQGTFTATGGEDHITIGNFFSDPATVAVNHGGTFTNRAYYYIDDIHVMAVCSSTVTNKTATCGQPWNFDTPKGIDGCSGTNVTVSVLKTETNGLCPLSLRRTWLLTDACGNTNTTSQIVTLLDNSPPLVLCGAANLIANPGFESYTNCPDDLSELAYAPPWYQPTFATPDWFNPCATISWVSVPNNFQGSQTPFEGQNYAGLVAYSLNSNYREYMQAPLLTPMVAGQTYIVSFKASLADVSGWAASELGVHFSSAPVTNYATQSPLPVVPQIENAAGNSLTSSNGWMLVQGTYTASGGESFITIGNFRADNATTVIPAGGTETSIAYYYIDDVQIQTVCNIPTNVIVPCGTPIFFPDLTSYDLCSGTNVSTGIATVTNSICPLSVTRTWTFTDACGNSTNISQTMGTAADTAPPFPACAGTNMVPNGSFEDLTSCPMAYSQFNLAAPWFTPSSATPDVFDVCSPQGLFGVPTNVLGDQAAFDGTSYAGAICFTSWGVTNSGLTWREYLEVPLSAPLLAGQTYYVSFRVSLADACGYAIANIGAHFSVGAMTTNNMVPFAVAQHVGNPANSIITSSNTWTLIQGYYTATGGENHLTLGNFVSDAATTMQIILPTATNGDIHSDYSYYYFDDVQVLSPCQIPPEVSIPCGSPITFPSFTAYDLCSGTNITTAISTVTNSLCPLVVTRTWTFTDLCGNSTNISQQVFVTDNQPPVVDCECILTNVQSMLFTNGCTGIVPNFAFLTNAGCVTDNCGPIQFIQSPVAGAVVNPGVTPVTLTFSDCQGNSTNCVVNFVVQSPLAAVLTPPNIYTTTCSNSAVVNYNVTSVGAVSVVNCSPPSGSNFPLGTNVVACIMTTTCGQSVTNNFLIIVRPARVTRWGCLDWIIGIPFNVTNRSNSGLSTARVVHLPDLTNGGHAANFENFAASGADGPRFQFGAAEKFSFSTELNFAAANGAGFDLTLPPGAGETNGTTLLRLRLQGGVTPAWHVTRPVSNPESPVAMYRTIAIGTNGELFSSFTQTAAQLNTNLLVKLTPQSGVTSVVMTVTVDCRTREMTLAFPFCGWTPDNSRKGWDGFITSNGPRGGAKTNATARFMLTPLATTLPAPATNLDLMVTNLTSIAFDNPSITAIQRPWNDGHVTILKAHNDGTNAALDFTSFGDGGGVQADLGHAASFEFRVDHFETGDVPTQEQFFNFIDSRTFTNSIRFTRNTTGVECAADFSQWGVSMVTVQLRDDGSLVDEIYVPASLATALVTLDDFPIFIGSPGYGTLRLQSTNDITVVDGLSCSSCTGDELLVIPDIPGSSAPPDAFIGLECLISDGMDNRISQLSTTPACTPAPINASRDASGLHLNWSGDGFRLQGAETLAGPWYDLGVTSPVTLPANSKLRLFRLRCD